MATTILPKKAPVENPIATDDEHQNVLVADPMIPQFSATNNTSLSSQPTTISNPQNTPQSVGNTPVVTGAASTNAASGADILVANDNTDWINKKWRPAMGWVYMATCVSDFIIFPILWSMLQAYSDGRVSDQWQPLTLQGAGLFHIAMGAVLGIAAYGRTKEKLEGAA